MPKANTPAPMGLSPADIAATLKHAVFTIESVAHLRGLERRLLPHCDALRKEIATIEAANADRTKRDKLIPATHWPFPVRGA